MASAPASPSKARSLWKGKEKETVEDFDDLNPTITYRHLFSQNLGVRDPLRVVALCDSDAFYAACEMIRLGVTDKPLVVLQWESLIAVNYPAREYGISRMDKVKDAKERCPDLMVVHVATYKEGDKEPGYWDNVDTRTHKVSLDYYRRESAKILGMFKDGLPGAEIEKASIDEAFMDLTRPVREILLQRYPYLAHVPDDAVKGVDSPLPTPPSISWDGLGYVIPIVPTEFPEPSSAAASAPASGAIPKEGGYTPTWHDVALSIGAELMQKLRNNIQVTLGYTLSAGIARNKFLAKLTASYKKPNSQSILRNNAIPMYLRPMPFQKIRFLGGKLGDAIAKEYDVSKVEDLLAISLEEFQHKFGEDAIWVYEIIRGIDRTEVKEKIGINKSMLASKNLPTPITKPSEGYHWIRVLAAELALRLNEARESSPNLWPKTIVLHARKRSEASKSKQAPFPFTREVTVDVVASAGNKLWKELVGNNPGKMTVTSIQLSFTGIEVSEIGQKSIDGFLKPTSTSKRSREDDSDRQCESGPQTFTSAGDTTGDRQENTSSISILERGTNNYTTGPSKLSFACNRCGKRISLPPSKSNAFLVDPEREQALAALEVEHDDWHFAQELSREHLDASPGHTGPDKPAKLSSRKKKKRKESPHGIEKFFTRK